jgi:hypothetical protein
MMLALITGPSQQPAATASAEAVLRSPSGSKEVARLVESLCRSGIFCLSVF